MTPEAFDKACRALPGVTMDVQWGDDHVYKVGGKMFAVYGPAADNFSFKASDIAFEVLTETGRGSPAPYLAKAKWVWFASLEAQNAAEVEGWLTSAHGLVAAKLTKKLRAELGVG
ncbi:MmcQ/YjbR family DNA-binding protein [Caulobacter sp. SLTY]|uniref:MmcQ/YjbR family DNA-binding protein n=1 Tax=Caulobacter sp. SLTY TaxID=2683262 RepID=UPI001412009D|nr:MmcQ/YjbR family DNA-binding protein [Caulobacter sp. SLTY]NBB14455.1 MmcQ/YjbR family DNA-binding protein [Caulobacter sp. SLTY]